ncbi:MAG TPA: hypothetical protein VEH28_03340 [Thermoplasmata archaeon]|nr:hypothetical protein [Thermoplasmata archaeon]
MVHRLTLGIAMVPVGAVIVTVLLVAGLMLASTLHSDATQASVSGSVELSQAATGPVAGVEYSNLGNRPVALPPLSAPLLRVQNFSFSLGPAAVAGSVSSSAGTTSIALSSLSFPSNCKPGLTLSAPSRQGYINIGGAGLSGPATLSAVFAGSSSWPAAGYGLMVGTNLSSLFVIQVAGSGNTTATVTYDNYSKHSGQITGEVAQSLPFAIDAGSATEFTLSLTGIGGFVVSVDGVARLSGSLSQFVPGYSPLAVWSANATALLGLVTAVAGTIQWAGASAVCGSFWLVPLWSNGVPVMVSNLTAAWVVGPVTGSGWSPGSLYVLEGSLLGTPAQSAVSLHSCNPVSLLVNGTLAFTAPWEG